MATKTKAHAKGPRKMPVRKEVNVKMPPGGLVIQEGFEIPDSVAGASLKYPWDQMKIGDSFFVECATKEDAETVAVRIKASGRLYFGALREKGDGSFRAIADVRTEDGKVGVRAWKVAR